MPPGPVAPSPADASLPDLSVESRAARIRDLQRGHTSRADEEQILQLFLGARGPALTALKNAIDDTLDHRDLQQLVHHDIDDDAIRTRLLDHLRSAAAPTPELKVLSDIDDTFFCNWLDKRYPKGTIYPGVRALYRELDLATPTPPLDSPSPAPADSPPPARLGDLVFLTARPGDRIGLSEGITRRTLAERGLPQAKVLTGSYAHLLTNDLIAERKYTGFVQYRHLYPEYDFVFLGDSGQGDAIAGALMLAHPGGRMRAVFIHDVLPDRTPEATRAAHRTRGLYFHDTYVGAATSALKLGLLDLPAATRVAAEALADLAALPFPDPTQREAREADLRRDVAHLNALLPESARLPLTP